MKQYGWVGDYRQPEIMRQKDDLAKSIIEKAFPGRKVIALNVEVLNEGGEGIHCARNNNQV